MKNLSFFLFLFFSFSLLSDAKILSTKAEEKWRKVLSLERRGENKKAIKILIEIASNYPLYEKRKEVLLRKAQLLKKRGEKGRAVMAYQDFFEEYPDDSRYDALLKEQIALVREILNSEKKPFLDYKEKHTTDFIEVLQRIAKSAPHAKHTPELLFSIANAQLFRERDKEAMQTYQKVIDNYPKSLFSSKSAHKVILFYFSKFSSEDKHKRISQNLENLKTAKKYCVQFLVKYPHHRLTKSVKEIQTKIGLIEGKQSKQIKEFYRKNLTF